MKLSKEEQRREYQKGMSYIDLMKGIRQISQGNTTKEFGQRLENSKKYKSQKIKQKRKRSKK